MTREEAHTRWRALGNMTTARGCTEAEARTAASFRRKLEAAWGFKDDEPTKPTREFYKQWSGFSEAVEKFRWEFRKCGKKNCWCAKSKTGHGPYKYKKQREGKKVRSIYIK